MNDPILKTERHVTDLPCEIEDQMKTWTDLKGQKWEIKSENSGKKVSPSACWRR